MSFASDEVPADADTESDASDDESTSRMDVYDIRRDAPDAEGFVLVTQDTSRGAIEMRHYPVPGSTRAAIFVGGSGGGFDTPVRGWLYPRLCKELQSDGITAMRIAYREPGNLEECVMDVLAGIGFLEVEGVTSVALIGHSFGGAVVIQAAALSETVRTCIPMSTQTQGTSRAATLGPRCSLLLAHGEADEVLPPTCSQYVYSIAKQPKELLLKAGAHHGLDEWSD